MARKNTNLPYIYTGSWSGSHVKPDPRYCAASSYGGGWNHQCLNRPKHPFTEELRATAQATYEAFFGDNLYYDRSKLDGLVGYGFCNRHNPVNVVANMVEEKREREEATAKARLTYAREQAADAVKAEAIAKASARLEALGLTLPQFKADVIPGDHIVNVRLSTLNALLDMTSRVTVNG
jgi:hypothetical protein